LRAEAQRKARSQLLDPLRPCVSARDIVVSVFTLYTSHSATSPSCETKPIRSESCERQVLCSERVMLDQTAQRLRKNKANSRRRRVGRGRGDEGREANVQNEPNCRRILKWEASGVTLFVRNKPNLARATRMASFLWKRSYAQSGGPTASEEQSQFPTAPGGPGGLYKQTQFASLRRGKGRRGGHQHRCHRGQPCETNPIRPGRDRVPTGERCETNPIPGDARWDGAAEAWDAGQMCETNPISGEVSSMKCQASSKSCQTNPIWGRQMCKTKPIFAGRPGMDAGGRGREVPPGSDCAKRTQFPAPEMSRHSNVPLFQRTSSIPIVRNKANSPTYDAVFMGRAGHSLYAEIRFRRHKGPASGV
jgi:hypothetical protein